MRTQDTEPGLILASGSPRRRELLKQAGLVFETIESGIDETRRPGEGAREYALRMARKKALAVSARRPQALVLGADTVVECAGEVMSKPVDAADARRMLTLLSGRGHQVTTAFALARGSVVLENSAILSRVAFRVLSDEEIERYILSGEAFDKAGSYGIQGASASFLAQVEGSRDNVMGLPVCDVLAALKRYGASPSRDLGDKAPKSNTACGTK